MDIFGEAKKAFQLLADGAVQQADYLKLQARLGKLDEEKQRQLVEVGKRAEELWQARQIKDRTLDILMKRITDIDEQMDALRQEIIKHAQQEESDSGESSS